MSFDPFSNNYQPHVHPNPPPPVEVPDQAKEEYSDPLTLIRGVQSLLQTRLNEAKETGVFDDRMYRALVDGATKLTNLLLRYQHQLEAMEADQTFESIVLDVLSDMGEEMKIDFLARVEQRLKSTRPQQLAA